MSRLEHFELRMPDQVAQDRIGLRPAQPGDFGFCASLYFAGMEKIIQDLNLDIAAQSANLRERWDAAQVQIITVGGTDAGWLQSRTEDDAVFVAQLFVDRPFQRRGIGQRIMTRLIDAAACDHKAVTLGVVKTNPALHLYERLGFRITHDDDRKFYMRREA
jgi:ribosomal protein S18 acetylase RimI-like enzyme